MDVVTIKKLDEFYYFKVGRNTKHNSAKNYIIYLKQFFDYVDKIPEQVTIEDIESYIVYLKVKKRNAINTQKIKQTAIRLFFDWFSKKYHKENPTEFLPAIQEEINIPVMPTPDELTRMVYACDVGEFQGRRDAALLCLMADTGLRRSEVSALDVGNIQLHENNYICIVPKIKSSRERMIPFAALSQGSMVGEYFTAYYLEIRYALNWKYNDPLFKQLGLMYSGNRLGPAGINYLVRKYAKKAGIERRLTAHSFRHFFGTYSIINKTEIRELQKLMGHAWLETTERYIHISESITASTIKHRGTTNLKAANQWTGFIKNAKDIQRQTKKH